jgi:hypothetical protein
LQCPCWFGTFTTSECMTCPAFFVHRKTTD